MTQEGLIEEKKKNLYILKEYILISHDSKTQ